jgi:CRP/FNR family cyclic AMP-dependent transcriptional regulator
VPTGSIRDALRTVLCRSLTAEEAEQVAQVLVPMHVAAGQSVIREGDAPGGLYVLFKGAVEVSKRTPDGGQQTLARIEAPTVVGEMSLITERPHSATVIALTDCELRMLTRAQFRRLITGDSLAAYKVVASIAEVLAGRLARIDEKIVALSTAQKLFNEWSL